MKLNVVKSIENHQFHIFPVSARFFLMENGHFCVRCHGCEIVNYVGAVNVIVVLLLLLLSMQMVKLMKNLYSYTFTVYLMMLDTVLSSCPDVKVCEWKYTCCACMFTDHLRALSWMCVSVYLADHNFWNKWLLNYIFGSPWPYLGQVQRSKFLFCFFCSMWCSFDQSLSALWCSV